MKKNVKTGEIEFIHINIKDTLGDIKSFCFRMEKDKTRRTYK